MNLHKSERELTKLISIIVPAYNAEKFIAGNLNTLKSVLDQIRYEYEIICVDDGSIDVTRKKALEVAKKFPGKVKVVGYQNNLGKGHAVRFGMAKAKGDIIGFVDAGLELDANGISMLLEHFEWYDADIIVGSKRHAVSKIAYPWQRKILSYGYQILVKLLFHLSIRDTQVGMKFFRRGVLKKVLPRVLIKTFAFDVELLAVAHSLGFTRIYEAPINLKMKFKGGMSTIASKGFIKTAWRMLWDTMAVFYRLKILNYYDYRNRRKWITPKYLTFKSR